MKQNTLAVVALYTRHRGQTARNVIASRLEQAAKSLRTDMQTGTFHESIAGAGAVFLISEQIDEADES